MKSTNFVASALGAIAFLSTVTASLEEHSGANQVVARRSHRHSRRSHGSRRHRRKRSQCADDADESANLTVQAARVVSPTSNYTAPAPSASGSVYSNSTGGSGSGSYPGKAVQVNNVFFGMLPDGGTDGGSRDTMASLNQLISATNGIHATFGQYAQAQSGTAFDGSQLLQVMDDLKASGAIFEPAVMPTGGWGGLTPEDNSQAVNICNVMKKFTDEGIEVRLRFAHEVNWYLTDGTYSGTREDFLTGWDTVAKACRQIAPQVKMFFTPNVASLAEYESFFPTDPSTVDLIGIDYYPSSDLDTAFLTAMKGFHDQYASETRLFAIGETGLGRAGTADEKLTWIKSIAAAKSNGMPHITSAAWFNYQKGYNFKICDSNDGATTGEYVAFLQTQ